MQHGRFFRDWSLEGILPDREMLQGFLVYESYLMEYDKILGFFKFFGCVVDYSMRRVIW